MGGSRGRRRFHGRKGGKRKQSKKFGNKLTTQDPSSGEPIPKKAKQEDLPVTVVDESSSSESEEEITSYQQLMSTLEKTTQEKPIESDEEDDLIEEDEDDEEGDDEYDNEEEDLEEGKEASGGEEDQVVENEDDEDEEEEEEKEDEDDSEEDNFADESLDNESDKGKDDDDDDDDDSDDDEQDEGSMKDEDAHEEKSDPFYARLGHDIGEEKAEQLTQGKIISRTETKWSNLGCLVTSSQCEKNVVVKLNKEKDPGKLHIRKRITDHLNQANQSFLSEKSDDILSPLQRELFSIMNGYKDLFYPDRSYKVLDEVRHVYCLHILNHVVKCRALVLKHNNLLSQQAIDPDSDATRDQGLTRPRVLIVVPFREAVFQIVNLFIKMLLPADKEQVGHRKRFIREYGPTEEAPSKLQRPDDWETIFAGNIDDHFRIGMAVTRKSIRLYTDFYSSDIIIASPLGLRTIIGVEGEKRDFDFLSSIDILVLDQTDIFHMQNWEHIQHLMEHMHLQPKQSHDVDFSRVHAWAINGWSRFYRQTLSFSSVVTPEMNSLFNKHCHNYAGKVLVNNPVISGSICQIATALPQVFQRIECENYVELPQKRYDYFISKVLPHFRDKVMSGTLIFVPSYFDYVRLRNRFRKEEINFAQICEYTKQSNISRARIYFYEKKRPLMLYTERFHFFRRYRIKGIRHIIFYQLPMYPDFYSEICNMITGGVGVDNSCTVLYSKYDAHRLAGVVGMNRCSHMLSAEKNVHMFVTEEES
ncbi:U3 small nucleolar RNA-associated protein 25 homolog [Glandiceps talaboti]